MHPADITAALHKRGLTQGTLAGRLGVSDTAINNVVWSRSRSQRIEQLISHTVRLPLATLWPQWYGPQATSRAQAARPAWKVA